MKDNEININTEANKEIENISKLSSRNTIDNKNSGEIKNEYLKNKSSVSTINYYNVEESQNYVPEVVYNIEINNNKDFHRHISIGGLDSEKSRTNLKIDKEEN